MPSHAFEASLKRLGLSDKEAAVYVALLSLGPSSVLLISRKAGVARATTYLMLENLIRVGLVSTYEKNHSLHYVAEQPEQLRFLVARRRKELDKEEALLNDVIPKLQAFTWQEDQRPVVRYYQGKDGLQTLRSEMVRISQPGDTWYNFTPMDHLYRVFGESEFTYDRPRLARGIKSKTIFTTKSPELKEKLLALPDARRIQQRFISPKKFTSGTGGTIFGERVAMGTMEDQLGGLIIESASVAQAMRELFDIAWKALEV